MIDNTTIYRCWFTQCDWAPETEAAGVLWIQGGASQPRMQVLTSWKFEDGYELLAAVASLMIHGSLMPLYTTHRRHER